VSSTRSRSDIRGRREGNYTVYQHEDDEAKDTDLDIATVLPFHDDEWLASLNAGLSSGEIEVFDHTGFEAEDEVSDHSDSNEVERNWPELNNYLVCDPDHHLRPIRLRVSNLRSLQPRLDKRLSNQPAVQLIANSLRTNPHMIRPVITCVNLDQTKEELMPTAECKDPWNETISCNRVVSGVHLATAALLVNGESEGPDPDPQIIPHLFGYLYAFGGLAPEQIQGYLQTLEARNVLQDFHSVHGLNEHQAIQGLHRAPRFPRQREDDDLD